jgi:gamma-glutamylcyclotransferase (GGCT)/AIG2-like uncharacterized protein YtfP
MLDLFVYGSLKRGEENFAPYCAGFAQALTAKIAGRLYRQADGYPMLLVPESSVQAVGTGDPCVDARLLEELQSQPVAGRSEPVKDDRKWSDWEWIEGDLFRYDSDLETRLSRLDELEDFRPGQPSLYHRAIVAARTETGDRWVWTYVAPKGQLPPGAVRMPPRWP